MKKITLAIALSSCLLNAATAFCKAQVKEEPAILFPWNMSFSAGMNHFEGDRELEGGLQGALRLAYDYSERWSFEGAVYGAPELTANTDEFPEQEDSALVGTAFDAVFHFTRWEKLDPFLSAGIGYSYFTEDLEESDQDCIDLRGGLGLMYHIDDNWAFRIDYRGLLSDFGGAANANSLLDVGIVWKWSDEVQSGRTVETGGTTAGKDSDGDGLSDDDEGLRGTNYMNPDTDGDGVADGDEIKRGTDPLKKP